MIEDNVIEVTNVKKKFKIYFDKGTSLKERILFQKRNHYEDRWVLNGISFEVKKGEAIGLVGRNGCGKSTTLKMLTRIMYPTEGKIEVNGRVSSMLELGAGFHLDMSGRENIYNNAAIFGMNHKEIEKRIHSIIEFSELEEYIDNPVRTYSSGMYMRLAFSIAINVNADVLLIDEILGVGDVNFQEKCFRKLQEIKKKGTTIVIVSHSLSQIEKICNRCIWIEEGLIKEEGKPHDVHVKYLAYMENERIGKTNQNDITNKKNENEVILQEGQVENNSNEYELQDNLFELRQYCSENAIRSGNQDVFFRKILVENWSHSNCYVFGENNDMTITLEYEAKKEKQTGGFGFEIVRDDGICCYGTRTELDENMITELKQNGIIELTVNLHQLLVGTYVLNLFIIGDGNTMYDYIQHAIEFQILYKTNEKGISRLEHSWKL